MGVMKYSDDVCSAVSGPETSDGYADILLKDCRSQTLAVPELKKADNATVGSPEAVARAGLGQTAGKLCWMGNDRSFERLRRCGIAFSGKNCRVIQGWEEKVLGR